MKSGLIDKAQEPFSVRNKPFFDIYTSRKVSLISVVLYCGTGGCIAVVDVGFPSAFLLCLPVSSSANQMFSNCCGATSSLGYCEKGFFLFVCFLTYFRLLENSFEAINKYEVPGKTLRTLQSAFEMIVFQMKFSQKFFTLMYCHHPKSIFEIWISIHF